MHVTFSSRLMMNDIMCTVYVDNANVWPIPESCQSGESEISAWAFLTCIQDFMYVTEDRVRCIA